MAGARDERQNGRMRPTNRPARGRADSERYDNGCDLVTADVAMPSAAAHAEGVTAAPAADRASGRPRDDDPRQLGRWENEGGALEPSRSFA